MFFLSTELIQERNYFSRVFWLSELPRCRERLQTAICCLEWLGKLNGIAFGLDLSLSRSFLCRECVCGISHSVFFCFHQCISFYNEYMLCNRWH